MSAGGRLLRAAGPIQLLMLAGCVAVVAIAGFTTLVVVESRAREIATAERNLAAFDILLAEQTARAIQTVELVIKDVIEDELVANGIATSAEFDELKYAEDVHRRLQERIANIPQLDALTMNSADGRLINFSRYFPIPDVDISDRDYFKRVRDMPTAITFISEPVQNRGDGTWDIYIARRVNDGQGRFIGMVMGALRLSYFEDLYKAINVGGTSNVGPLAIGLWRSDGTLLLRYPPFPDAQRGGGAEVHVMAGRGLEPGETAVSVNSRPGAGATRLVASHLLDSGRLMVNVAQTMDQVLSDWRHDASVIIIAAILCTIATLLLLGALLRQFATYEAMLSAVAAREEAVQARQLAEDRLRVAQKLEAIGRLTSGVAHDFNNLLTSIIANTELLLRDGGTGSGAARKLAVVMQAADRGAALIRQLLAFSRQQVLEPTSLDLNQLIRGMEELLRSTAGSGIRLQLRLDSLLWPALVDAVQIEHLILNLVINARDAMPNGGHLTIITARASASHPDRPADLPRGEYVTVSVADTGTGMSKELQQQVFEPFFTTKGPGRGSGLGLSQVYGVARQSGGTVVLQSQIDVGTTVKVYLPRALASRARSAVPRLGAPLAIVADGLRKSVLLVDDDAAVRETLAATLAAGGYIVRAAEGGAQALRELEEGLRPDVVLLDRSMPDMDGRALAKLLRERLIGVPIVFMTGDAASVAGEDWIIEKPFIGQNLIDILTAALKSRQAATALR